MIWLLTKVFSPLASIFHFVGDHRYGTIALLLVAAAAAAWVYVPIAGRKIAKALLVVAVAAGFYDGGYSHRAEVDRKAWARAQEAHLAAVVAEHVRRDFELEKARREAELAEAALKSQQEEHARYMVEIDNASKANDNRPCLDAPSVVRLDRAGRRKKAR